jgi:hypothetical protein
LIILQNMPVLIATSNRESKTPLRRSPLRTQAIAQCQYYSFDNSILLLLSSYHSHYIINLMTYEQNKSVSVETTCIAVTRILS